MVTNRVGDRGVGAFTQRVPAAHFALELGELEDDERLEVGLAQARGFHAGVGVRTRSLREGARIRLQPPDLRTHRPELRLEHHGLELLESVGQRGLAILFDEEARIGQACAKNPVIAFRDGFRILSGVDHIEIRGKQRAALGCAHREISLVVTHH